MVRISNPLPGGSSLAGFTLASDGRHLAYVVTGLNGSTVFIADVTAPGTAHAEYNSGSTNLGVTVNRDASEFIITDPSNASTLKSSLIQSATGNATIIGASNPTVLQQLGMAFNPVSTEYYVTGQVGGSPPPMSGTGFTTLFAATTGTPDPLLQIGASYPPNDGEGSGLELGSTPDGARILHVALTYNHSLPGNSSTFDLLVNDRTTNSETYLYRKFGVFELMNVAGSTYAVSPDGTGVCFGLNQLPANASISTGQIWVADPRAPGSATAVTPVAAQNTNCQWAADSKTLVYRSATTGPTEPWVANVTHPGAVSRLREPMAPGDTLGFLGVSRLTMTAIAVVQPGGGASNFYRAALASPGTSVLFYSTSLPYYIATVGLDAAGTSLEMLQRVPLANSAGTMNQLHWVSTQVASDDLVVNRTDTATGVLQAQFLSQ
jgi:hypothetical protein